MKRSKQQAMRNEVEFRQANEQIAERRAELDLVEDPTPFLCECDDPGCTAVLRLTHGDYEGVRAESAQFVVAPGHEEDGSVTVRAGDGWRCIRKGGAAAEIAAETDPRR